MANSVSHLFRFGLAASFLAPLLITTPSTADKGDAISDHLAAIQLDPKNTDYNALRLAWTRHQEYGPSITLTDEYQESISRIREAEESRLLPTLNATCVGELEQFAVSIEWHATCAIAYRALGDPAAEERHANIIRGLADSILSSGDGLTPETAFEVILIEEEKFVLDALRLKRSVQLLVEHQGNHYDQWLTTDPSTGKEVGIYFKIDKVYPD